MDELILEAIREDYDLQDVVVYSTLNTTHSTEISIVDGKYHIGLNVPNIKSDCVPMLAMSALMRSLR